jgi:hypothetical protein
MTKSQTGSGNNGFIRDDAYLAVVIVADEDDCSAGSPNLFNASDSANARPARLVPLLRVRRVE